MFLFVRRVWMYYEYFIYEKLINGILTPHHLETVPGSFNISFIFIICYIILYSFNKLTALKNKKELNISKPNNLYLY